MPQDAQRVLTDGQETIVRRKCCVKSKLTAVVMGLATKMVDVFAMHPSLGPKNAMFVLKVTLVPDASQSVKMDAEMGAALRQECAAVTKDGNLILLGYVWFQ